MLDRLIEYAVNLPTDRAAQLTQEDIALCAAWYDSYEADPAEQDKLKAIPVLVNHWLETGPSDTPLTEGRRCQPLLRELIQEALDGFVDELSYDELDFLVVAYDLAQRAADPSPFHRVCGLLAPLQDSISARRAQLEPAPGLPSMSGRMDFASPEDIAAARPRAVKRFAGIAFLFQGPIFTTSGPLKILGNVPDGCSVVVEEGPCVVNGFVLGNLAVREYCEIRENISGVVVTRQGDIRARNIVDNAYVVAKQGSVCCREARGPKLIFAGTRIHVMDNTILGTYMAPQVEVGAEVRGGECHVSERLLASYLRYHGSHPLSVVLRQDFSCEDYGEKPSPEASQLVVEAGRLRRRVRQLNELQQSIKREADHYAQCALFYLIGGDKVFRGLEKTGAAQRRLTVLDRIISGLYALSLEAESKLYLQARCSRSRPASPGFSGLKEARRLLSEIDEERRLLEKESSLDKDLEEVFDRIAKTQIELGSDGKNVHIAIDFLLSLRKRLAGWIRERSELIERIGREETAIQKILGSKEILARVRADGSSDDALKRVMGALQSQSDNAEIIKRAQSNFLKMASRNLTTRLERAGRNQEILRETQEKLDNVCEQLRSAFQIAVDRGKAREAPGAEVCGRFEEGIRLYTDPFLLSESDAVPGYAFETPDSRGLTKVYARRLEGIVEVS